MIQGARGPAKPQRDPVHPIAAGDLAPWGHPMNPGTGGGVTANLSASRVPEGSHHRCGMISAAFLLPKPSPASGATPGHAEPPRTGTAWAGGHQHAGHPLAPETGSFCPQPRGQSRDA